jgi:hypothetical protein
MRRSSWFFLLLAPIFLCGGTCGSVLQAHVPDRWGPGTSGNFARAFGEVQVEVGGLVRQEGVSFMNTSVTNRGRAPVRVTGAILEAGSHRDQWRSGNIDVAPGATAPFTVQFGSTVSDRHCTVVLQLSTGDVRIELSEP